MADLDNHCKKACGLSHVYDTGAANQHSKSKQVEKAVANDKSHMRLFMFVQRGTLQQCSCHEALFHTVRAWVTALSESYSVRGLSSADKDSTLSTVTRRAMCAALRCNFAP